MSRRPWAVEADAARVIAVWSALAAALAAAPLVADEHTLPRGWRIALRLARVALLRHPIPAAIAEGASVVRALAEAAA